MHGENQHFSLGEDFQDLARGLQAVQCWHADVQDRYIWLRSQGFLHCFPAVCRFATDLPSRAAFQQEAHTVSHHFMIISHQDPKKGHDSPPRGRIALTKVPRQLELISKRPWSCLTRSRIPAMPTPSLVRPG